MADESPSLVHVVDSGGTLGTLPISQAKEAISSGEYRIAQPADLKHAQDKLQYGEGALSAAEAAGAGAARGLSLGLSDEALTNLGIAKPETLAALKQNRPYWSTLGEIGGITGGILATGGTSAAAKTLGVLGKPVQAVSRLGEAAGAAALPVSEAVAGSIASKAAHPLVNKVLSQAGALAAGSAVEGAAYGVGQSVSEHALGDPDLNAEKVFANVGNSALYGAGLGALFGAGKVAVPAVIDKASGLTQKVGNMFGNALTKASAVMSGKAEEDIAPLLKGLGTPEGMEMRQSALEGYADREKTVRDLTDGLSDQQQAVGKAVKEYYQGPRQEEISKLMSEVPHDLAFTKGADLSGNLKAAINEMRAEPELYTATGKIRQLEIINDALENKLTNSTTSEEVYHAINDAKQQIDPLAKFQGIPSDAERATIDKVKNVRSMIKGHLEDPAIYGEAGARQAALNSAYSDYAGASKDFLKTFGKKLANNQIQIDPGKVNTFLNQMGRPGADIKQQILGDYLEASQKLASQMNETSKNAISKVDTNKLLELFQKTQGITEGAESELTAVNQLKRLRNFGESWMGVGSAGLGSAAGVGAAAHFAGIPVAAAEAAYGVYHTLRNPTDLVRVLSGLERAANKVTNNIERGSAAIFKAAESKAGSAVRAYAASAAATKDKHDKAQPHLSDFVQNPQRLIDHLNNSTQSFSGIAPQIAQSAQLTSARAVQFLQSKLPGNNVPQAPLGHKYIPSNSELSKWNKYYNSVDNPTDVLHQIASGSIAPETMETLEAVYPKLLSEMQTAVMDKMTQAIAKKKMIPYRTKLSLSMFLGQDLVQSLDGMAIMENQSILGGAQLAKNAQEGQMNAKNGSLKDMEYSSRFLTPMQKNNSREDV